MKGFLLLVVCLIGSCQAQCPSAGLISPCRCNRQGIVCSNVQSPEQLIESFTTGFQETAEISQLMIHGSSIEYLPADVFRPIRSNVFTISHNRNLSEVDEDTFAGTEDFIRLLRMNDNSLQGVDIFVAMSKMTGLAAAFLYGNSLFSVPERALAGMPELVHLDLGGNSISSLGREAFADCPKLNSVLLWDNKLRVLPGRLLASDRVPAGIGDKVVLVLKNNQIEDLEADAFDGTDKSLEIILAENQLQTLPRETFQPLLDRLLKSEGQHSIVLSDNPFVCDCNMRWVAGNGNYFKILKDIVCPDTKKPLEYYSWNELICSS